MGILQEYDLLIKKYILNNKSVNDFQIEFSESESISLLIAILQLNIDQYKKMISQINLTVIESKTIDFSIILEARIGYLCLTKNKEKNRDFSKETEEEIIKLCYQVLLINPNAYLASTQLAYFLEKKKEYIKAISLIENIIQYGFKSQRNISDLLYLVILSKDWKKANGLLNYIFPFINRLFTSLLISIERYSMIQIILALLSFFLFVYPRTEFYFIGMAILCLSFFWGGTAYKNRSLERLSIQLFFSFFVGFLFGLLGRYL